MFLLIFLTYERMKMNKKILKIIVGLIWILVAVFSYRRGNNIATIALALLGLVFIFMGLKSSNSCRKGITKIIYKNKAV